MKPWLTILGIGDDGLASLTAAARLHFDQAQHIILPERVRARIADADVAGKKVTLWVSNIHETLRNLQDQRGEPVTILATGDPFHFGIAATLARTIPSEEIITIPHPSGFSLAANRMGWALQDVDCISLHGRKVERLQPFIEPDNRVLALTSNSETPKLAAEILGQRGFGASQVSVLEHMGGPDERIIHASAHEIASHEFADFNVLAIQCVAGENALIQPRIAGLPNDAFSHDGQLTKREVRSATLAALRPYPNATLWDIGAGCGSIAIEWMRAARGAKAIAFERDATRLTMIAENAQALGVPDMSIIDGSAPEVLQDQPAPDAVFIGGGLTSEGTFNLAWNALRSRGVLVVNTVTLEGEAMILALHQIHGGDLVRMDVSHLTKVGRMHAFDPRMSVLQWQVMKP
ncbi:MAG: precorrin-6y C5,15-methyltransferase (decarboxylating) subunit CbiE [Hyphomicrobiales bacterium]